MAEPTRPDLRYRLLETIRQSAAEQPVQLARQLGADQLLIGSLAVLSTAYYFAGQETPPPGQSPPTGRA